MCMSQCQVQVSRKAELSTRNLSVGENARYCCHASDDFWMTQDPLLLHWDTEPPLAGVGWWRGGRSWESWDQNHVTKEGGGGRYSAFWLARLSPSRHLIGYGHVSNNHCWMAAFPARPGPKQSSCIRSLRCQDNCHSPHFFSAILPSSYHLKMQHLN